MLLHATTAWNYLNGITCVYKPSLSSLKAVRSKLLFKLCEDLNSLKCRDLRQYVEIAGDTSKPLTVEVKPNYADHPLVVGPRYVEKDFKLSFANQLGYRTSGVCVAGINNGTAFTNELRENKFISVYHVKGRLGLLTDTLFADGKPTYKCNYNYLNQNAIDRVVATVQATHQKNLFHLTGVHLHSQAAYEMACSGLIKPTKSGAPVIYDIRCIDLNLPEFTLEISAMNENEEYFTKIIYDVGYYLKNVASTVSIRCIRVAFFTLDVALLKKHWTLENVLDNMRQCYDLIQKSKKAETELQPLTDDDVKTSAKSESDIEIVEEYFEKSNH